MPYTVSINAVIDGTTHDDMHVCHDSECCTLHTHQCRRCGSTIYCDNTHNRCDWPGDNVGCPNEETESAAELEGALDVTTINKIVRGHHYRDS